MNEEHRRRIIDAFSVAKNVARKKLPFLVSEDVAQRVITKIWPDLMCDTWVAYTAKTTLFEVIKEATRYRRENKAIDKYEDILMTRHHLNGAKREWLRDLCAKTLTPQEWRVVHGRYFAKMKAMDLAESMGMYTMQVWRIHKQALDNLRMALRRLGIDKENVWEWMESPVEIV